MGDHVKVTAAIIEKEGRVLIARRKAGHFADKWEFPGGKLEAGETPEGCLKRELNEELGIEAKIGRFVVSSKYTYGHAAIELLAYEAEVVSGELSLREHKEIRWVPVEELASYDFPEADKPVIRKLIEEKRVSGQSIEAAETE